MAEQLNKTDYINHPNKIGSIRYFSLEETIIRQLQNNWIINSKTKKLQSKKPDALITDDRKNVLIYIDNGDIGKSNTEVNVKAA